MKIHSVAKFQKKIMEGYPAIARTHGRTCRRTDARNHATENNGPSPINWGTKNINCEVIYLLFCLHILEFINSSV